MTVAEKLQTIAENTPRVYDAGQKAAYDRFWDAFQMNGERKTYNYAFYAPNDVSALNGGSYWNDETFRPKYPLNVYAGNGVRCMLTNSEVTRIEIPIKVTHSNPGVNAFYNNPKLHTIASLTVRAGVTFVDWFAGDTALKNLTMHGTVSEDISFADCPLTNESVQSLIGCLKDLSGKNSRSLTLSTVTASGLTQAQKDAIAAKNWRLVY